MLRCIDVQKLTTAFLDGALGPFQRLRIKFHMAICGNCKKHVQKTAVMAESMSGLAHPSEPPDRLKQTIESIVGESQPKQTL